MQSATNSPQGVFVLHYMKNLIIILLILLWTLLVVKSAGSDYEPKISLNDQYITAYNSPITRYNAPGSEFNPNPTLDGYCVSFVQQNGFSRFRGNANEWIKYIDPDIKKPQEGYAIVMSYGTIGHLGIYHNGEVWEQNFGTRGVVTHRPLDSSRVIGYIK